VLGFRRWLGLGVSVNLMSSSCLHPRLSPADYRGAYLSRRAASTRRTSSHPVPRASPAKFSLSRHRVAVAATAVPLPPPASTSPPPPSVAASRRRCRRLPTDQSRRSAASRPTGAVAGGRRLGNRRAAVTNRGPRRRPAAPSGRRERGRSDAREQRAPPQAGRSGRRGATGVGGGTAPHRR